MLKIRRSRDRLIFYMGILIAGKTAFTLRRGPGIPLCPYIGFLWTAFVPIIQMINTTPMVAPPGPRLQWWTSPCTLLFKSNGIFFLRWQNMVFIFKVQTWNFVCGIRRSFAFTMENILSVWYTATPGWTFTFGKVWKNALSKRCNTGKDMAIFSCFLRWQILK